MTRDDMIRMALEAGIPAAKYPSLISDSDWEALERFFQAAYAAGAAAEREACARFVEDGYVRQFEKPWREDLAAAIRARGQA